MQSTLFAARAIQASVYVVGFAALVWAYWVFRPERLPVWPFSGMPTI